MQCLGKYLDIGETLYNKATLVEGFYKYSYKATMNKFRGMIFDMKRDIMMSNRITELKSLTQEEEIKISGTGYTYIKARKNVEAKN